LNKELTTTSVDSRTQLKLHSKPVIVLNTLGYFSHLLSLVDSAVTAGFIREDLRAVTLMSSGTPDGILPKLISWDGSGIVDVLALKKAVGKEDGAGLEKS
jgi:hypothetical protein